MAPEEELELASKSPHVWKPADISVQQLLFDPENPRMASVAVRKPSQKNLLKILWEEMAVDEIALSIASNGYFREEPILVVKSNTGSGGQEYYVVEGNRRLAAVMLLRDEDLRRELGATRLPKLNSSQVKSLDTLPVLIYPNRQSIWSYMGFRHVHGVKPWDSFSKANYVADIHEREGISLRQIADRIGDTHATVERLYRGYAVLMQAEDKTEFTREDRATSRFAFSHLYTALNSGVFQKFLGIKGAEPGKRKPVPKKKFPELQELVTWLYGSRSRDIQPVIRRQQPDLWSLRDVIDNRQSLAALRAKYTLDQAHGLTYTDVKTLRQSLVVAKDKLQRAKGASIAFDGEEDLLQLVRDIVEVAQSLLDEMVAKDRAKLKGGDK